MRTANFGTAVRTDSLASSGAVGMLMNDLRIWLDHQHIEPADFVPIRLAGGQLAFDVHFRHEQQAVLFEEAFGPGWKRLPADLLLAA
jgi:hypothetical protein